MNPFQKKVMEDLYAEVVKCCLTAGFLYSSKESTQIRKKLQEVEKLLLAMKKK